MDMTKTEAPVIIRFPTTSWDSRGDRAGMEATRERRGAVHRYICSPVLVRAPELVKPR